MGGVAALLFVGFLASLWVRDRLRKALCRMADPTMRNGVAQVEWLKTYDTFLHSTAQAQRLALLKLNLTKLPSDVQSVYSRYRRIEVVVFVLGAMMILFWLVSVLIK